MIGEKYGWSLDNYDYHGPCISVDEAKKRAITYIKTRCEDVEEFYVAEVRPLDECVDIEYLGSTVRRIVQMVAEAKDPNFYFFSECGRHREELGKIIVGYLNTCICDYAYRKESATKFKVAEEEEEEDNV